MKKFIVGDLHGGEYGELQKLSKDQWKEQRDLTKEDILFQLGDFGFYFYYPEYIDGYKKDLNKRKELAKKKYSMLVIPGNHENYDLINKLPTIKKWGGEVYVEKFDDGELYLAKRGEIYEIDGKKYFTFSGALSADTEDRNSFEDVGLTKRIKKYRYGSFIGLRNKKIKISGVSYWKEEISTQDEKDYAIDNLSKHNYKVDYILTHTCPDSLLEEFIHKTEINGAKFDCPTAKFLEEVYQKVEFKHWYFGHLHTNYTFDAGDGLFTCHYSAKPIEIDI